MSKSKKRKARRTRSTSRTSKRIARVPREPTVEPKYWAMNALLFCGREQGGIDAEQFESAIDIVDAFRAITRDLGYRPLDLERIGARSAHEMSPREVWLSMIYFAWGVEVTRRLMLRPHVIVEWIAGERTLGIDAAPTFSKALDLWEKARDDLRDGARREHGARVKAGRDLGLDMRA